MQVKIESSGHGAVRTTGGEAAPSTPRVVGGAAIDADGAASAATEECQEQRRGAPTSAGHGAILVRCGPGANGWVRRSGPWRRSNAVRPITVRPGRRSG